jgi:hypothetical protein
MGTLASRLAVAVPVLLIVAPSRIARASAAFVMTFSRLMADT